VRNIKEHVSEGKKIVCKVLATDHAEHIDVSLKRVTSSETKRKLDEIKNEQRSEKLIESIAVKLKEEPKKALAEIGNLIVKQFGSLADFSAEVKKEGPEIIHSLNLPANWDNELYTQISEQIKAQFVRINTDIEVTSFEEDGLKRLKNLFEKIKEMGKNNKFAVTINYISAPRYRIELSAKNYKEGEIFIEKLIDEIEKISAKQKIIFKLAGESK
jgi:translation initiation factor 2 subunit 1